jgi:transcriptional regulator with XRE-family HTH domain
MSEPHRDSDEAADLRSVLRVIPSASFPNLLRTERASRKLSQAAVAEFLKVRPQTIGAWEAGKSPPQPRFHEPLARFLGLGSAADVRSLLSRSSLSDHPADGVQASATATPSSPGLEIRLNLSRRIAAGVPLTAETIELFNRLLDEADKGRSG